MAANQVGLIDGRYAPVNDLGQGGYGAVYLATDTETQELVAIKFLSGTSSDAPERFRREARVLTELQNNPNVVKLIDHNLDHTPPYLVMEYCEGGSLRSWVGRGKTWREITAALVHVVLGLDGIHRVGGFHRDLKPDNILVKRNTAEPGGINIKVGDWGLARAPGSQTPITRGGAGTDGYIAPEILAGGAFDARADIYSLGVVASELLTGERSGQRLGAAVLPEKLRAVVRRMLSPNPNDRPTAQSLAQVLLLLSNTPNVPAAEERVEEEGSGFGAFLLGGLLVGGALVALAALAGGEAGSPPAPKPGGGGVAPS